MPLFCQSWPLLLSANVHALHSAVHSLRMGDVGMYLTHIFYTTFTHILALHVDNTSYGREERV
jgi:hypothetical protein